MSVKLPKLNLEELARLNAKTEVPSKFQLKFDLDGQVSQSARN